ncbi:unnamed protein product [Adineta steineri]|uniref:Small conductance calcium-activated potassium channel protein n=2 Tax=Adineta steineri TaxID=433720 RepID=A0A818L191_9BILA|nr:unnamed protein product [Adineta steineri]
MTSHETVPSSLSNTPTTVISSIHSSQDCFNPVILMTSNSIRSVSSKRSTKKKCSINLSHKIRRSFTRKPRPPVELIMTDMSYRLRTTKFLNIRLALVSDGMCLFGILGIILMIVDNELTFNQINDSDTRTTWIIKPIISLTTIILLVLIFYYHYLDLRLYAVQNSLQDYRVGLTKNKICLIVLELLICAIHPVPHSSPQLESEEVNLNSSASYSFSYTAIDVGLGLPMFARLYLFGRSIVFHSHLVRNISLRSISYLNQVSINFFFLMKIYLQQWPTRCLMTCCTIIFLIGSWSLRACSYKSSGEHLAIFDAMWLFIITFTTVGYGDLYPSTYCGRAIATIIGFIGLLSSALLISVLAQKLLLTREEKYVHTFVSNTELAKERQYQAANIVKFAIKVWFLKRQNKAPSIRCIQVQKKLFQSIYHLKEIKKQQRNSTDNCIDLHELVTIQQNTNMQIEETVQHMTEIKCEMNKIQIELNNMILNMNNLQTTLNILLNK